MARTEYRKADGSGRETARKLGSCQVAEGADSMEVSVDGGDEGGDDREEANVVNGERHLNEATEKMVAWRT